MTIWNTPSCIANGADDFLQQLLDPTKNQNTHVYDTGMYVKARFRSTEGIITRFSTHKKKTQMLKSELFLVGDLCFSSCVFGSETCVFFNCISESETWVFQFHFMSGTQKSVDSHPQYPTHTSGYALWCFQKRILQNWSTKSALFFSRNRSETSQLCSIQNYQSYN